MKQESLILLEKYIQSWLDKDKELFLDTLADNVVIAESYGPKYSCKQEAEKWFIEWNKQGQVIDWKITDVYFDSNKETIIATWHFTHEYPAIEELVFDGCTILKTQNGKITDLYEYAMKYPSYQPYK